jgi:hypothetical protein
MNKELPKFDNKQDLFKYLQENDGLFGWYCRIPYGHNYEQTHEKHVYKIVGCFGESNCWSEIPHTYQSETPTRHDEMEFVVNVIECGIDETKVLRFALKDIEPYKICKTTRVCTEIKRIDTCLRLATGNSVSCFNYKGKNIACMSVNKYNELVRKSIKNKE